MKLKIFISFLITKESKDYVIQYIRLKKSPPNHPKIAILLYFLSDFFFHTIVNVCVLMCVPGKDEIIHT